MQLELYENIPDCKSFMWYEFLYLREWEIYAFPNDVQYYNICKIAKKLQFIRDKIESPIYITSGLRPKKYNEHIKGAIKSLHLTGSAVDFTVRGYQGREGLSVIRKSLLEGLDSLEFRMENLPTNWIHIDLGWKKGGNNYFTP